jgi:hypothetical protein
MHAKKILEGLIVKAQMVCYFNGPNRKAKRYHSRMTPAYHKKSYRGISPLQYRKTVTRT